MPKSDAKAKEIIVAIGKNEPIDAIKARMMANADEWHKYSLKAYSRY
jgi:hypothetical protein